MNSENILFSLVKNMSVIVTFAYILSKSYTFQDIIERKNRFWKIFLIVFCVPLAIAGTYLSIQILDALANIRSLGAIVGGIYGGPLVGMAVGLVAGIHRWSLGGFTAFACGVGVVVSGLFGGMYHIFRKGEQPTVNGGMAITAIALLVEMGIVVILSRPVHLAVRLVQIITIPMTLSNMLGVGIFLSILENAREEINHVKAVQSRKALNIANQTLPYLRKGLDFESAAKVVEIIYEETGVDAVAITDNEQILAFKGEGEGHHLPGDSVQTEATKKAISQGSMVVVLSKAEIGCNESKCTLDTGVVVPLRNRDHVMGVLKLYRVKGKKLSPNDVELARGISSLLSNQMEIARLSEQAQLTVEAELKALQTQINPHFLFNAINTIISYIRTEPMVARNLLIKLAEVFRYTLQGQGYLCSLEDELRLVRDYMSIEQARFGERVQLHVEVPDELLQIAIPRLSLQPLVENAIRHGVSKKLGEGIILVKAQTVGTHVDLTVEDNGVGVSPEQIDKILTPGHGTNLGIGLSNVHQRLVNLFGEGAGVRIQSVEGEGTIIRFTVPRHNERRKGDENSDSNH